MTVLGNTSTFGIELVPAAPSWKIRYAPERAAWAGTAIWVDGRNLCSHVLPGSSEVNDFFFIPLGPIADWLVRAFPAIEYQERAPFFPTNADLHESVRRWGEARPGHHGGHHQDRPGHPGNVAPAHPTQSSACHERPRS
jgi:hypothetical protein